MNYTSLHGRVLAYDQSGLLFNKMPIGIPVAGRGRVFWVDSNTGRANASGLNPYEALTTVAVAVAKCSANRGDTIVCLAEHAESISSATALQISKAGITVYSLGEGRRRATFTLDTANTATIAVSADKVAFKNCRFVANFLSIAACFTLTTAKGFRVQDCEFIDTSGVLNFLNIIKSTGAANTIDSVRAIDCKWNSLGTTSVNTFCLSANDVDDAAFERVRVTYVTTVDQAGLLVLTAGIATNLLIDDCKIQRKNTTTANGSLFSIGGTVANCTGFCTNNKVSTLTTASDKLTSATSGVGFFNNLVEGVAGTSGFLIPTADS